MSYSSRPWIRYRCLAIFAALPSFYVWNTGASAQLRGPKDPDGASSVAGYGAAAATQPQRELANYSGTVGVTVTPRSPGEYRWLRTLAQRELGDRGGPVTQPMVFRAADLAELTAAGLDFQLWSDDLEGDIRAERARRALQRWSPGDDFFSSFHAVADYQRYIDELAAIGGDLVRVQTLGTSVEGQPIRVLAITAPSEQPKPGLFIIGLQHAREWIGGSVAMYAADRLIRDYGSDPEVTALLDAVEVHVVPMMNPDGYAYSRASDRMWRKNRGEDGAGVDLNRNWGFGWGGAGTSDNPNSDIYHGPHAFSEPETRALRDYVLAHDNLHAAIDFHCQAQYVVYPSGCLAQDAMQQAEHLRMAGELASAISDVHGVEYTEIRGYDWYPACGASDDWHASVGMLGFTVEVRGNNFMLPDEEILPTSEENFAAVLRLAQWVRSTYPPDDDDDTASSGEGESGTEWTGAGSESGASASTGTGSQDDSDASLDSSGNDELTSSGGPAADEGDAGDGTGAGCRAAANVSGAAWLRALWAPSRRAPS